MQFRHYKLLLDNFIDDIKNDKQPKNKKILVRDKIYCYFDGDNKFAEIFDNTNGFYICSDILDDDFNWTGKDPDERNAPALLDVGIMGHCSALCKVGCYQSAEKHKCRPNMTLEEYKKIIDEVKDTTFQIALGGAGNPNDHENFEEILEYTVNAGLVPNFTTSGHTLNDKQIAVIKKYCGAVAVSWHPKSTYDDVQDYTLKAVEKLTAAGIKTNIHYVLGKESLDNAISRFKNNTWPNVNAMVFLRYKPVGLANKENCLDVDDPRTKEFFEIVDNYNGNLKIGFDSCSVAYLDKFCKNIVESSKLPCEGAKQSMYIGPEGMKMPCSFGNSNAAYHFNGSIMEAWKSGLFKDFKNCENCPWLG